MPITKKFLAGQVTTTITNPALFLAGLVNITITNPPLFLAGLVTTTITNPLDVIKTRMFMGRYGYVIVGMGT
jgi:hypothetical protein